MTERRRIFLNIVATYGRSVYYLVLGLFTARWALNALGKVDYGLVGVVGGLAGFVGFIVSLLSFSVSRFYAVSVGAEKTAATPEQGIEECRKWFNTALAIHTVVPVILVVIGYPIGEWAVRHFLTIPPDRIYPCVWLWRTTCLTCFVGMFSVPFNAMYSAKQDIAELTIYGFCTATLNACFLGYMITHPGDWLLRYAIWGCAIGLVPTIVQMIRAFYKYPECRYNRAYLFDLGRLKEIAYYSAARFWTMLSNLVSGEGNAILVNKFMGPAFNASMTIGNSVVSHTTTLSSSLTGAFSPAIMNAAGAGEKDRVIGLSFQMCRLGSLLVLIFMLPLALEINEVLVLWLKNPPPYVAELVIAIMVDTILERMSEGLYMPIVASGKGMARYSWWAGWCGMARFAIAWALLACGLGFYGICLALVIARVIVVIMRMHMGRILADMSARYWLRRVFCPLLGVVVVTLLAGLSTRFLPESFMRVCLTAAICEAMLFLVSWFFVLSAEERTFVRTRLQPILAKFHH